MAQLALVVLFGSFGATVTWRGLVGYVPPYSNPKFWNSGKMPISHTVYTLQRNYNWLRRSKLLVIGAATIF
eukprot:scaffold21046_cov127-Skeletonema_marinoi.AAC.2